MLQIFCILWAFALRNVRQRWLALLGLFVLMYIAIALVSTRAPIKVFMSYATFSAHNAYWRGIIFEWGMVNVWAHPIFGIGLNDWVRPFFMRSGSIDNFWLVNAVRYGIPGFCFLVIGYLPALWWISRRNFDADERLWLLRRAWVFTFAGLTLTLCTVHVWTSVYSFVFFMFGAGMWFLTAQVKAADQSGPALDATARSKINYSRLFSEVKNNAKPLKTDRKTNQPSLARAPSPVGKPVRDDVVYSRPHPRADK